MPNSLDRPPLISFALIAYNQEKFIREAIRGAFSQTYEPLEIILSDDCSQDNTFALMQESAGKYTGPHRVILNRNLENSGIGAHINRIMELANGQFVVIAAGDDISLPERTMEIFKVVNASEGKTLAVFSDMIEINGKGIQQKIESTKPQAGFCSPVEMCTNLFAGITGASNSWDRRLFDFFGPMSNQIVFEDRVIAFRAALLGNIHHIAHALVLYRRHEDNTVGMFHSTELPLIQKRMNCFRDVYLNNAEDLERYAAKIDHDKNMLSKCRRIIRQRIKKYDAYLLILSGNPFKMVAGFFSLVACRGNPIQGFRLFMQVVLSERVVNSSYPSK